MKQIIRKWLQIINAAGSRRSNKLVSIKIAFMNYQTLNKQRKFILIAAAVGLIATFLPWKTISAGLFGAGMSEGINGFHGSGILSFLVFIAAGIISIMGNQTTTLDKSNWLVALACGVVALLCAIENVAATHGSSMGFMELGVGVGCWIALVAAIGVIGSAWLFRSPGDNLKEGFDNIKRNLSSLNTPSATTSSTTASTVKPEINKIAELEKLVQMKAAGHITEEEYQNMKSKLL
jgi:hypothetical protein